MPDSEKKLFDQSLKLLARSSFVVLIALLLSKVLAYAYRIIIARFYGPEVYGLFALSLMITGWIMIFAALGLSSGLLRFIPYYRGKRQNKKISHLVKTSQKILLIITVLSALALFLASDYIAVTLFDNAELGAFLKIFSLLIPVNVLSGVFRLTIKAYEKIGWFVFLNSVLGGVINLVTLIVLILIGFSNKSVPISYVTGASFILVASYLVARVHAKEAFVNHKVTDSENRKTFREMFSYSWPLIFSGLIFSMFHWTDSFLIGIFKSIEEVGLYNAAVPIALLILLTRDLFTQLFFPLVTKEYSKGNLRVIRDLTKQVGKWIFILSIPILALFLLFPGAFIKLLFGQEYVVVENAMRFLSVGVFFSAIFGISNEIISMKGKTKVILADVTIMSIVNVILNVILIPRYGVAGAGFSTMVSMIFLNIIFGYQSWKYTKAVPLKSDMVKIFLVTLIPAFIVFWISEAVNLNLLGSIVLAIFFILMYVFLVLISGSLDKNDLLILKLIKGKIRGRTAT